MSSRQLTRSLANRFVMVATVGGVVGLGILRGPGEIAAVVPNTLLYLGLWLLGGLFVLLSTSVVAELLGLTPRSGGTYVLVRRAFGPFSGFVIGWVDWLSFAADIALKAVVITEFAAIIFPQTAAHGVAVAIAVTTFFAAVQLRGIRLGALVQEVSTALIGLIIIAFSLLLFFLETPAAGSPAVASKFSTSADWSLVIAMIIFTYDGWLYASYFGGEIKGGAGAVARMCIKGMVVVICLYMLMNLALASSVDLSAVAGSELALATALDLTQIPGADSIVITAAILILLAHQNLAYMAGSRILHALAVDGLASDRVQKIGKGGNPVAAIVITWLVTVGLILVGGFEFLLLLSVFFYVPIYLALIIGVMRLRKREPESERPYRAWGHPYSTHFCLTGWAIITLFQAWAERETALYALAMVAIAWPVYRYLAGTRS